MKKNLKVGLYNPYLDTLGGGEKHILSILQVLADEGYEINIFWDRDLTKQIKERFALHCFKSIKFLPNIFKKKKFFFSTLRTLWTLKTFDYFFYVTDGSYFFSPAKKNYIFAMVPNKELYNLNTFKRLKLFNFKFISNSVYTKKHLQNWGIDSQVIYPYVDDRLIKFDINKVEKQPIILSIGRFFGHLHSKKHAVMINLFKKIKQQYPSLKDFKLILAGGLKEEDKDYFLELKKIANGDPSIELKPNIPLYELYRLYRLSTFFWHFTGYGIDENKNPEQVEHLGIAPLEAMAAGCLTFCYNAGGPKEIITDGNNGFLFNNENELINKTILLLKDEKKQNQIKIEAKKHITNNFSYPVFKQKVRKIILNF